MDRQTAEARESAKKLPFGKKISHIWMYYKGWIIAPLIFLLAIGYTVYEIKSRPDYDIEATFFSEVFISEEQIAGLEKYLSQFVEDRNGDGETNIKLFSASVAMMDNEIEGAMAINTKFSTNMAAGSDSVILVDSAFYEIIIQDAYVQAIETPQELTAIPEVQEILKLPEGEQVYWVTRAVYQDEQDDAEAIFRHDMAQKTEENIFGSRQ